MNIEPLVNRLEELIKIEDVEQYLFWKDMEMNDSFIEDENIIEYETIKNQLEALLVEEINKHSLPIFENVDLRNFDLREVEQQLIKLVHPHFTSRSTIEVKRDQLLGWYYDFYNQQYKRVDRFIHLENIDKDRRACKEKVMDELIKQFSNTFTNSLLANTLQAQLRNLNDFYNFLKERAKKIFDERSEEIKERDNYAYLDLACYLSCLKTALKQTIDIFQASSKDETVELYMNFLRERIAQNKTYNSLRSFNRDLYNYASTLFDNRTVNKVEDDNFTLIELDTYLNWRHDAVRIIENEYPSLSANDNRIEYYYNYHIGNSGYEKYGGYNGYDDDTIDDAFEGDPSNTWNVD